MSGFFASLFGPADTEGRNTVATVVGNNYVIVGCGFAAVLNHTTLRQTQWGRTRIGNRKVIHIGFPDPWRHYRDHGMGQFPHLLVMPGYHNVNIDGEKADAPRRSKKMAADTWRELKYLKEKTLPVKESALYNTDVEVIDAWVVVIQSKEHANYTVSNDQRNQNVNDKFAVYKQKEEGPDTEYHKYVDDALKHLGDVYPGGAPRYRLLLVPTYESGPRWVYADKIDICTGMGIVNHRTKLEQLATKAYKESYTLPPWAYFPYLYSTLSQQPVVPAQHALFSKCWIAKGAANRICLIGGGGVSVNLCETLIHDIPSAGQPPDKEFVLNETWLDWTTSGTFQINLPDRSRADFYVGGIAIPLADLKAPDVVIGINTNYGDNIAGRLTARLDEASIGFKIAPYAQSLRFAAGVRLLKYQQQNYILTLKKARVNSNPQATEFKHDGKYSLKEENKQLFIAYQENDAIESKTRPKPAAYQQVILNEGMVSTPTSPGTAAFLIREWKAFQAIKDYEDRLVGVQYKGAASDHDVTTGNGDIRILGQAGLTYYTAGGVMPVPLLDSAALELSQTHNLTMPEQARLDLNGITYCALSVALANKYFDENDRLNKNINTASENDLKRAMNKVHDEEHADICAAIVKFRALTSEGIMDWGDLDGSGQILANDRAKNADPNLLLAVPAHEVTEVDHILWNNRPSIEQALGLTYEPNPLQRAQ